MRTLLLMLLLVAELGAQIAPPTQSNKIRHGATATVSWKYVPNPSSFPLRYFSVKSTYDLNVPPKEIKQAPPGSRSVVITVQYDIRNPKYMYYVVTGIYDQPYHESLNSNTIQAERIGPPPTN